MSAEKPLSSLLSKLSKHYIARSFGAGLFVLAGMLTLLLLYAAVTNFTGRKLTGTFLVNKCQLDSPKETKSIYHCFGKFTPDDKTKHAHVFTSKDPIVTKRKLVNGSNVQAFTVLAPGVHDTANARLYIDGVTTSRTTDTLSLCLLALVSAGLSVVGFFSFRPRRHKTDKTSEPK